MKVLAGLFGKTEVIRQVAGQPDQNTSGVEDTSACARVRVRQAQPGEGGSLKRPGSSKMFHVSRRGRKDLADPVPEGLVAGGQKLVEGFVEGSTFKSAASVGHITSTKNSLGLPMAMWNDWRLAVSSGGTEPKSRTGGAPGGCKAAAAAAGGAGGGTIITTMGL